MDNNIVKDKRCTPLTLLSSSLGRLDFKPLRPAYELSLWHGGAYCLWPKTPFRNWSARPWMFWLLTTFQGIIL